MIRKSGSRFSEKITLHQKATIGGRSSAGSPRSGLQAGADFLTGNDRYLIAGVPAR
jgi:hypothetical protein